MSVPFASTRKPAKRLRLSLKSQRNNDDDGDDEDDDDKASATSKRLLPNISCPNHLWKESDGRSSQTDAISVITMSRPGSRREMQGPWVAGLTNLGNTCFLNSVLHVLRFSPGFLCHLHHLCHQINDIQQKAIHLNASTLMYCALVLRAFKRSFVIGGGKVDLSTSRQAKYMSEQILPPSWKLVLQLHEVFNSLRSLEDALEHNTAATSKGDDEELLGIHPLELLNTLRQLNPLFEGNCQHDAHELLCCLLNYIRDVNQAIIGQTADQRNEVKKNFLLNQISDKEGQMTSASRKGSKQQKITSMFMQKKEPRALDLISTMFEGQMLVRTRCTECEHATEMKEHFLDVGVSVGFNSTKYEDDDDDYDASSDCDGLLFREALLASETLTGDNKYWCDMCYHHNEARRTLHFDRLPPVLMVQLKRFSAVSNFGLGFAKVSDYMYTPLQLECLLDQCPASCEQRNHRYRLFAIITHAGISLSSGHYVSLVKRNLKLGNTCSANRVMSVKTCDDGNNKDGDIVHWSNKFLRSKRTTAVSRRSREHDVCAHCACCQPQVISLQAGEVDTNSWLQCDDHKVVYISESSVTSMLSKTCKETAWTPYLLFYTIDAFS